MTPHHKAAIKAIGITVALVWLAYSPQLHIPPNSILWWARVVVNLTLIAVIVIEVSLDIIRA